MWTSVLWRHFPALRAPSASTTPPTGCSPIEPLYLLLELGAPLGKLPIDLHAQGHQGVRTHSPEISRGHLDLPIEFGILDNIGTSIFRKSK
jgi:hypothetical protein